MTGDGGPPANCDRDLNILRFRLHFRWFQGGVLDASYAVLHQNENAVLALSEEPYFSLFPSLNFSDASLFWIIYVDPNFLNVIETTKHQQ